MPSKIRLLKIICLLFLCSTVYAQTSQFTEGFKAGFIAGFCQGDSYCTPPATPNVTKPLQGESNYQDGFKIGTERGIALREKNNELKTNEVSPTISRGSTISNQPSRTNISTSPTFRSNKVYRENRGFGLNIGYNGGITTGFDVFLDKTVFGVHYGSRILEDSEDVYATETALAASIGFKMTNSLYIKIGIGEYYDDFMDMSSDYDSNLYDEYSNYGTTFFKIGLQGFFKQSNSALSPEIYYSNSAGIGLGIGIVF